MKSLPRAEFETLIRDARILEADKRGPKVYETSDGCIIKLFRIKRRLSSNLWSPFATRFEKNAKKLKALGLPSVEVLEVAWVQHIHRQMVVYRKLEGQPLRSFLRNVSAKKVNETMRDVGRFIAAMQEKGVFFRSLHFGNILVLPGGDFALIDILDVWFKSSPLGVWRRGRNFRHMSRYKEDCQTLLDHWDFFRKGYLETSFEGSMKQQSTKLENALDRHLVQLQAGPVRKLGFFQIANIKAVLSERTSIRAKGYE
ncbi:MAG: toluene tolerance protein [Rariglobus sp.]